MVEQFDLWCKGWISEANSNVVVVSGNAQAGGDSCCGLSMVRKGVMRRLHKN